MLEGDRCQVENRATQRGLGIQIQAWVVRLNRVIRVGLIEKVTFEQRFKLLPELFST